MTAGEKTEKILAIIEDKKTDNIGKLTAIWLVVSDDKSRLSKAIGIPENLLAVEVAPDEGAKPAPGKSFRECVAIFHDAYLLAAGLKYKYTGKDFGQMKILVKAIKPELFRDIMNYFVQQKKIMDAGTRIDNTMKFIIDGISPGMIVSKMNYLIEHADKTAQARKEDFKSTKWEPKK